MARGRAIRNNRDVPTRPRETDCCESEKMHITTGITRTLRILRAALWLACLTGPAARAAQIKSDEEILFFPTHARLSDDGTEWLVPIHGWVFEPEKNSILRRFAFSELRQRLELDPAAATTRNFEYRAGWLVVDNERDKPISVRIGEETLLIGVSGEDGHVEETVRISVETARRLAPEGRLEYRAVLDQSDRREFKGVAQLVPPQGLTVISDIDDTIKVSEVTDHIKLVRNTLFNDFAAVEGMAGRYRQWAEQGALFCFVSGSPWQLYVPLREFLDSAGFPEAAWRLRPFRVKDASARKFLEDPYDYKLGVIEPILAELPQRRFVLVGDSGEKDPEVYGELARRHPDQVQAIHIRDVTGEPREAERYGEAFREVAGDKWRLFREAEELPATVQE